MAGTHPSPEDPTALHILIVRLGAMGDVIHALPAVATLRWAMPNATIGWVIEERWLELLSTHAALSFARSPEKPLIDRLHVVNTKAWRSALLSGKTWRGFSQVRREIRAAQYDVALDFQGAWKSGILSWMSGAHRRIGFANPRERGAKLFYTQQVPTHSAHVIEHNFELLARLASPKDLAEAEQMFGTEQPPLLPADPAAESWCSELLHQHEFEAGGFAIINPGAGWGSKCWPSERYAEVARGLRDLGIRSLVNFGPAEESLARQVESASGGAAAAITCSISQLIALTRRARLFVGGDTGPMHLAAALNVPVAAIFGPTDPARNGPFATDAVVLRRAESVTNHSRRGAPDQAMLSITSQEVLQSISELLNRNPGSQAQKSSPEAPID